MPRWVDGISGYIFFLLLFAFDLCPTNKSFRRCSTVAGFFSLSSSWVTQKSQFFFVSSILRALRFHKANSLGGTRSFLLIPVFISSPSPLSLSISLLLLLSDFVLLQYNIYDVDDDGRSTSSLTATGTASNNRQSRQSSSWWRLISGRHQIKLNKQRGRCNVTKARGAEEDWRNRY